ncbi:MAG: hypothetical protein KatS3mg109_0851 [Pirellulaceae bacterium]|nr:MAG: hypothetical protein KatS3mg109_0851 [Pirellulaceae bacterium]
MAAEKARPCARDRRAYCKVAPSLWSVALRLCGVEVGNVPVRKNVPLLRENPRARDNVGAGTRIRLNPLVRSRRWCY